MWPHRETPQRYRDEAVPPEIHSQALQRHPMQQTHRDMAIAEHLRHHRSMHPLQHEFSQQHRHPDNPMTMPVSSNPRASRNMAEKQRRDNLNTNISTMATLIPTVAGSSRRLDKISILRLAAAYLRTQYALGSGTPDFLPRKFNDFDLEQYVVDNLVGNDGFILVVTPTGKIIYISRQIEQQLGHAQNDLLGQSLYSYVYPEDHEELTKNLSLDESSNQLAITEASTADDNSNSSEDSTTTNARQFSGQRRSFNVRMSQRTVSRREHTQYECLHVSGILRPADACRNNADSSGSRTRNREFNGTSNDVVFVGIARMMKKRITELSLLEANKEEYVTRHLVDGRIIFCDHRISVVAGYMTQEVSGMSAFSYMHAEDVMWTIMGLRQMYDRREGYATSCYRLKTKTGDYIYLRTHAFVEVDKVKQSFESFVCVNTYVSKEEGERLVNEMKTRFAATISDRKALFSGEKSPASISDQEQLSTPKVCVEDPTQLENAISHLVNDLTLPPALEECPSPGPLPADTQIVKAALISQRLPPASIHASQAGIKDSHGIPSISLDKYQGMKREGNDGSPASTDSHQYDCSSDFEESRHQIHEDKLSSSPIRRCGGTPRSNVRRLASTTIMTEIPGGSTSAIEKIGLPIDDEPSTSKNIMFHADEEPTNVRYPSREKDFYKMEITSSSSIIIDDDTGLRDSIGLSVPSSPILSTGSDVYSATMSGQPGESAAAIYVKTETTENTIDDFADEQLACYGIKRSHNDDSVTVSKKRRRENPSDTYHRVDDISNVVVSIDPTTSTYDETGGESSSFIRYPEPDGPNPAVVHCKLEQLHSGFSNSATSPRNMDSPGSSLHDSGLDYQRINSSNLEIPGYNDEQLVDFPDLQVDPLMSPDVDNNPELMEMFDDLRPVIGFEKTLDARRLQQQLSNEDVVNVGLRKTHMQLANSMTLQESQLCGLERDLENPVLQAQLFKPRERLTELRAEQKKNTRMLRNIQQDHHNMQVIGKQNIGV